MARSVRLASPYETICIKGFKQNEGEWEKIKSGPARHKLFAHNMLIKNVLGDILFFGGQRRGRIRLTVKRFF